jgi:hypothetical protein
MLHHTASTDFNATVAYLCRSATNASANYVVGKAGEVAEIVPPDTISWHAGSGSGFGVPVNQMNDYSIGIEIVNLGDGKDPFPEAQLDALDALIAYLDKLYGVVPIIDHKEWTTRKVDMRENFPLVTYKVYRKHKGAPYQLVLVHCDSSDVSKYHALGRDNGFAVASVPVGVAHMYNRTDTALYTVQEGTSAARTFGEGTAHCVVAAHCGEGKAGEFVDLARSLGDAVWSSNVARNTSRKNHATGLYDMLAGTKAGEIFHD